MPAAPFFHRLAEASRNSPGRLRTFRVLALATFLIVFAGLYFFFASQLIRQTNQNRQKSDQQNNIDHTRIAHRHAHPNFSEGFTDGLWRWFPHHTDGVVNPLWPWTAARLAQNDASDQVLFTRGKWLNVTLTCMFCVALGLVAARFFSATATVNLVLLVGFGALLPRSAYFQPEPLYFMLFCLCWLCCLRVIHNNAVWTYALLGVLAGLAYLAKTSIQPLVLSFLLVTTYRFLQDAGTHLIKRNPARESSQWHWQRHFVGVVFFAIFFLVTAGPRLSYAHEQFGAPFHSYPGYWMWLDDFEEGAAFMMNHQNRADLAALDDTCKPSLRNYLNKHGSDTFRDRLVDGFGWTVRNLLAPKRAGAKEGDPTPWRVLLPLRGVFLGTLLAILAGVLVAFLLLRGKAERGAHRLAPEASPAALFVSGCALLYALAYGWYAPIGKGDRFLLSVYAPLVISFIWGAESIMRRIGLRAGKPWIWVGYRAAHLCLFAAIAARLWEVYQLPYFYSK